MKEEMELLKKELWSLIQRTQFAHISYIDDEEKPQVKMLFCNFHIGMSRFFFSTNTSSQHVQELSKRPKACVYISDSENFKGLALTGEMITHHDYETKKLLWHDTDIKYYPKGVNDEDYTVLEFVVESGRYYNGKSYDLGKDIFYDKIFGTELIENK